MLKVTVDPGFHTALKQFSAAAADAGVPWLVIGATARMLLLEKIYGWPVGIGTEDTDFAVQVQGWEHYDALCRRFSREPGIEPLQKPAKRFKTREGFRLDLLPYGGVEENNKQVFWPPDRDDLMTVRGFRGAANDAVIVQVNGDLDVPPPGLFALKLFAWEERGVQQRGRDAKDLASLLLHIERLISADLVFEEYANLAEAFDYRIPLAATAVMGHRIESLLDEEEKSFLAAFLKQQAREDGDLVAELRRYMRQRDNESIADQLLALHAGIVCTYQ